jgi:hypothetical protein
MFLHVRYDLFVEDVFLPHKVVDDSCFVQVLQYSLGLVDDFLLENLKSEFEHRVLLLDLCQEFLQLHRGLDWIELIGEQRVLAGLWLGKEVAFDLLDHQVQLLVAHFFVNLFQ